MMAYTLRVPELGEDVESVDVVAVLIEVGDELDADQPVIEVETEKASVEVPTDRAGTVTEIHVATGDSLTADDPILTLEPAETAPTESGGSPADKGDDTSAATDDGDERSVAEADGTPGASSDSGHEPQEEVERPAEHGGGGDEDDASPTPRDDNGAGGDSAPETSPSTRLVPAAPSVRRFAREIGVDIGRVKGSGPGGRISTEDVKTHARQRLEGRAGGASPGSRPLPDFSRFGPVEEEPASTIRRVTAERVAHAWRTVPQVTHHDLADITRLEKARRSYRDSGRGGGAPVTVTAILVRVTATALRVFSNLNSSLDTECNVIIRKGFVNVGVAVDTPHGLLVPVIRDADRKSIVEIAAELDELAARARDRKLAPADMEGGTFSISNLGGIGGTGFSPIVNWPEVGILGVSRASYQPVWDGEAFDRQLLLPLSLSYDHRLVDGAEAARFLRWLVEALEEPLLLALEG